MGRLSWHIVNEIVSHCNRTEEVVLKENQIKSDASTGFEQLVGPPQQQQMHPQATVRDTVYPI